MKFVFPVISLTDQTSEKHISKKYKTLSFVKEVQNAQMEELLEY